MGRHWGPVVLWLSVVGGMIAITFALTDTWYSEKTSTATTEINLPNSPAGPTVELPANPVEITSEELRAEVLQLGEELLARFPREPAALHVVALLYADLQKTTEAGKIWRNCIPLAPQQPGPYIGLATAEMELGNDAEAVAILNECLANGGSTPDVYGQLATALTKLGKLDEAERVGLNGVAAFPRAADIWLQLGQVQNQLGKFAEAETSLRQALDAGVRSESILFALATACSRQAKADEAAKYREEFSKLRAARLANSPDGFQSRYDLEMRRIGSAAISRAGTVYAQHGDSARAETLFLRSMHILPEDPVVYSELVVLYRNLDRIHDARVVQQRLADLDPGHVMHRVNLASLYQQSKDHAAAEQELKQVIHDHPDLAIGYYSLAQVYLHVGALEQARRYAEAAIKRRTHGAEEMMGAYLVLAAVCERIGDQVAAQEALARARQYAQGDPSRSSRPPD